MFDSIGSPSSLLTGMYSYPGEFAGGIEQVLSINENGISILAVVLIVCLILYIFYHKE